MKLSKLMVHLRSALSILVIIFLFSCNNSSTAPTATAQKDTAQERKSFFPVTSYIKGQINEFQQSINPIKYTTINDKTDSVFLKIEDIGAALKEFLTPEIDSTNLIDLFSETKFLDRSYDDAFTFTYDPIKTLPDTFELNHWVVYVDAQTGTVKKIYMVKSKGDKELQLTWKNNEWCSIVTIVNNPDGTSKVEKEEKIVWSY